MNIYYLVAGIAYSIFIIQFVLSMIGHDTDIDLDWDGDSDIDTGSLFSFKGVVHFVMGCFSWLSMLVYNGKPITGLSIVCAILVGFLFLIILFGVYKVCISFKHIPSTKVGNELVGKTGTVYYKKNGKACIIVYNNGESQQVICHYDGEGPTVSATITKFENGIYYI